MYSYCRTKQYAPRITKRKAKSQGKHWTMGIGPLKPTQGDVEVGSGSKLPYKYVSGHMPWKI